MKKVYLFIVALSLFAIFANAQTDPNAKKILDEVSSKVKTYKGITASFALVSKNPAGKVNQHTNGKIMVKGNKYYIKQGATEIFSDGNKTWNYNGNNEVTVTAAEDDENTLTPKTLLTNFYDKDYTYKLVSSSGNYNEIQLAPIDKRKHFKQVNVFVDKAKKLITRARILDKSNNTVDFTLTGINTSANIPDDTFVFNKSKYKKDIEVIE
jgi:outer membrane lipoprotein carrier protein